MVGFAHGCGLALRQHWRQRAVSILGQLPIDRSGAEQSRLGLGLAMTLVWNCVAVHQLTNRFWSTIPMFLLLALASGYTGVVCRQHYQRGANVLTTGFWLWPLPLTDFPFQSSVLPGLTTAGYLASVVAMLCIAAGMLILMLEESGKRNETLIAEVNKGAAHRRLLEQEISISRAEVPPAFRFGQ